MPSTSCRRESLHLRHWALHGCRWSWHHLQTLVQNKSFLKSLYGHKSLVVSPMIHLSWLWTCPELWLGFLASASPGYRNTFASGVARPPGCKVEACNVTLHCMQKRWQSQLESVPVIYARFSPSVSHIFPISLRFPPSHQVAQAVRIVDCRLVLIYQQFLHSLFCSFWFWQKTHAKNGNCITPYYAEVGHVAWLKQHPFFWYPSFSRCGVGG